jgi:hypothetical protein
MPAKNATKTRAVDPDILVMKAKATSCIRAPLVRFGLTGCPVVAGRANRP